MAELALDEHLRNVFAGHLDSVGMGASRRAGARRRRRHCAAHNPYVRYERWTTIEPPPITSGSAAEMSSEVP